MGTRTIDMRKKTPPIAPHQNKETCYSMFDPGVSLEIGVDAYADECAPPHQGGGNFTSGRHVDLYPR